MLALILTFFLAILNFIILSYFSEHILHRSKIRNALLSFGAGVTVVYLLGVFLPEIYIYSYLNDNLPILLSVAAGFIAFHLLEKYFYRHVPKLDLPRKQRLVHVTAIVIYHLLSGIVFVQLISENTLAGIAFFVPLVFVLLSEDFSLHFLHGKEHVSFKVVVAFSAFIGVVIGQFLTIESIMQFGLYGFVAGVILFIMANEMIPKEKEGTPGLFSLGVIISIIFFFFVM